nr:hypothetical protein [uncultured bacterium]
MKAVYKGNGNRANIEPHIERTHKLSFKILKGDYQHPKTFAVFFPQMLVMHFVGSPDPFGIPIVCFSKHFKALVDKNIVHYKIGGSVSHNSKAYGKTYP